MNDCRLELYWSEIPVGKENALTRQELCSMWGVNERTARAILNELSRYDNGDDYILIRSGMSKGFYKTTDPAEIAAYRKECLHKGRSIFAPLRKINRVTAELNADQYSFENNLRLYRTMRGMTQAEVVSHFAAVDTGMDVSMLSRMESGRCLPTPFQLLVLARVYGCTPQDLVGTNLYEAV